MFEKLFSKLKIGINMSSSPVDPTADKKQTSSSSKASEVGKYFMKKIGIWNDGNFQSLMVKEL